MTELESQKYLRDLRRKMVAHFNLEELQTLALDLSIDWDVLLGKGKVSKVNSLITHQARRGRLADLMTLLWEERPDVGWPDIPPPEQQIEDEGEVVPDSVREATLQDYLHKMGTHVVDKRLPDGAYSETTISIARAYTEAVISRLDKRRLLVVFRFLAGISLAKVGKWSEFDLREINLSKANLSEANLSWANLSGADLTEANLTGANLSEANLTGANLRGADLRRANLRGADLRGANLTRANLRGADLTRANLRGADLKGADLSIADLSIADLSEADLAGANLSGANLSEANLSEANLSEANLRGADLRRADLRGANLRGANLRGAKGWTADQLENAASLKGATMPNMVKLDDGTTFEDWKTKLSPS